MQKCVLVQAYTLQQSTPIVTHTNPRKHPRIFRLQCAKVLAADHVPGAAEEAAEGTGGQDPDTPSALSLVILYFLKVIFIL